MDNVKCTDCYFFDGCRSLDEYNCDDFYPSDENVEDEAIDNMIEDDRDEYREAWFKYIEDDE